MAIKEKPAPKWRHELKHRINAADDLILAARLRTTSTLAHTVPIV